MQIDKLQSCAQGTGAGIRRPAATAGAEGDADVASRNEAAVALQHASLDVAVKNEPAGIGIPVNVAVGADAGFVPSRRLVAAGEDQLQAKPRQLLAQFQHLECRHGIKALRAARAENACAPVIQLPNHAVQQGRQAQCLLTLHVSVPRKADGQGARVLLCHALFSDNIYNVGINIREMIRYNNKLDKNDGALDDDRVAFYKMILDFDNISSKDKIKLFNEFKDRNFSLTFYDDLRKLKDASYDMIKNDLLDLSKYSDKVSSIDCERTQCLVYDLSLEPDYVVNLLGTDKVAFSYYYIFWLPIALNFR